jgi:hypothetical protein
MSRNSLWLVALMLALQGCTTLSGDACRTADWYDIGYRDGTAGRPPVKLANHPEACAEHAVTPDSDRYRAGRQAGLSQYCQPPNGFDLGGRGDSYAGVCPQAMEPAFLEAYRAGREIYEVELQIRRLDSILVVNESELERLGASLHQKQAELARDGLSARQRARLLEELRELEATAAMVKAEIDGIRGALGEERNHLLSLRQGAGGW